MLQWIRKNKDKRGFTLIEFLVIIAIIGLLSAIILVSIQGARAKAKDAAIKTSLVGLRNQAEIDFDANGNNYSAVCEEAGGTEGDSLIGYKKIADSITNSGGSGVCNESTNSDEWAAWSVLVYNPAKYWCVDSGGASGELTSAPGADSTSCGISGGDGGSIIPPEVVNQDSPFMTNDFGIPIKVAQTLGITTAEQMTSNIISNKIFPGYFTDLQIKWARQHPNYFATFGWTGVDQDHDGQNLDFTLTDALVKLGGNYSINILAGLSPLPFDTEWKVADSYIPQNRGAYFSYVQKTVERYDGDGINDMPGLKNPITGLGPIKYWQLENEPDLHNTVRARGCPDCGSINPNFSNASEYLTVLKLTHDAIKAADPDSKVMINVVGYGQGVGDISVNYLNQLNSLGANGYYDIFSYHIYPASYDTSVLQDTLQNKFKPLVSGKPIWITESGINGKLRESEINQAAWVIKDYVFHIANGVKKIDWLTFKDMSPNLLETTIAKYAGLITSPAAAISPNTKKLSYYTYKKMAEVLEGSDWSAIEKIQESGGIYIYKFIKNNKSIWVAWNDNPQSQDVAISGISSRQVKITEAVPKYSTGEDVTDYSTAFNAGTKTVSGGLTITLGDKPVFVEEK